MASSLLIIHSTPRQSIVINPELETISQLINQHIPEQIQDSSYYLSCNGRLIYHDNNIENGSVYHCVPTLLGGKGGFGSMLRAIGAQIEKTTSREACRDLSGRRMRDVNNEKKLKEWLGKQADREREKEERRQERLARRRAQGKHNFDDPIYVEQRSKVADDLEDALRTGLQKEGAPSTSDTRGKRKADSKGPGKSKRAKEWLGIDLEDLSSSDSGDDSSSGEQDADPRASATTSESESQDGATCSSKTDGAKAAETEKPSTSNGSQEVPMSEGNEPGSNAVANETSGQGETIQSENGEKKSETDEEKGTKSGDGQGEVTQPEKKSSLLSALPPPQNNVSEKKTEETKLEDLQIDLEDFSSASELEDLGLEQLKFALTQRGLKCGGTLQQRAERLFSVKGLTRDQIDPALFPKAQGKGKK